MNPSIAAHGSTFPKSENREDATRAVAKRPRVGSGSRSGPGTPADPSGGSPPGKRRPAVVGDQLFGFQLHHELGHGAFAREAPESVRTRLAWIYGFAVSSRLPDKALQAFDDVLRRHPRHVQALYGRAMILAGRGQEQEAIGLFDQVIDADPGLVEARRFRAILLARAGKLAEASQDINWCLAKEPQEGATYYAAACVASLAADKYPDRAAAGQAAEQGLAFLQQALTHGYGTDRAATDPDLAGLRRLPQFDQLLREGSALRRRAPNNY